VSHPLQFFTLVSVVSLCNALSTASVHKAYKCFVEGRLNLISDLCPEMVLLHTYIIHNTYIRNTYTYILHTYIHAYVHNTYIHATCIRRYIHT
jgi:hypothetical protein